MYVVSKVYGSPQKISTFRHYGWSEALGALGRVESDPFIVPCHQRKIL